LFDRQRRRRGVIVPGVRRVLVATIGVGLLWAGYRLGEVLVRDLGLFVCLGGLSAFGSIRRRLGERLGPGAMARYISVLAVVLAAIGLSIAYPDAAKTVTAIAYHPVSLGLLWMLMVVSGGGSRRRDAGPSTVGAVECTGRGESDGAVEQWAAPDEPRKEVDQ